MDAVQTHWKKIAIVSVVMAVGLSVAILVFGKVTPELLWLKMGAISSVVTIFWLFFERWGWSFKIFRLFGWLCDYPDLRGRWEGELDRRGENSPHKFIAEITQTYSTICMYTYSEKSRGKSIAAHLATDKHRKRFSVIAYWECTTQNRRNPETSDTFRGTSVFEICSTDDGNIELRDRYFTDREPEQTRGKSVLRRVGRKLYNQYDVGNAILETASG